MKRMRLWATVIILLIFCSTTANAGEKNIPPALEKRANKVLDYFAQRDKEGFGSFFEPNFFQTSRGLSNYERTVELMLTAVVYAFVQKTLVTGDHEAYTFINIVATSSDDNFIGECQKITWIFKNDKWFIHSFSTLYPSCPIF